MEQYREGLQGWGRPWYGHRSQRSIPSLGAVARWLIEEIGWGVYFGVWVVNDWKRRLFSRISVDLSTPVLINSYSPLQEFCADVSFPCLGTKQKNEQRRSLSIVEHVPRSESGYTTALNSYLISRHSILIRHSIAARIERRCQLYRLGS